MDLELALKATEALKRALEARGGEREALLEEARRLHRWALDKRPREPRSFEDEPSDESTQDLSPSRSPAPGPRSSR